MTKSVAVAVMILLSLLHEGEAIDYLDLPGRRDCDLYDVPSSKDRVCNMSSSSDGEIRWYTGTLDSKRCLPQVATTSQDLIPFCPGYLGMKMSLWCNFENATVIYKDGVALNGNSSVTYSSLQKQHEGLYQCRTDNISVAGEFNLTVEDEIHIGWANQFECSPSYYSTVKKCCIFSSWRPQTDPFDRRRYPFAFSVYGEDPKLISVSSEWLVPAKYHYPTDLELAVKKNSSDPTVWTLNFDHYPMSITNEYKSSLQMDVEVIFANTFSSFSICIRIVFEEVDGLTANISLPQSMQTTEGGVASFFCEFGSNLPISFPPSMHFELSLPEDEFNNSYFLSTNCKYWKECERWNLSAPQMMTDISVRPIQVNNNSAFILYRYEVRLTDIDKRLNGSTFGCSISSSDGYIEWEGYAELIVDLKTSSTTVNSIKDRTIITSVTVLGSLLLMLVVLVVVLLAVIRIRKWKYSFEHRESALVPLTDRSYLSASQSTINSEAGTPTTEHVQLPAISIMEVGGARRDVVVGEMAQETRSMDSGVSCTEDYDSSKRRPNSLQMSDNHQQTTLGGVTPMRLCRSEADILDSEKTLSVPVTNMRIPRQKINIYISYTDRTSKWVRSTLKPLIDSWNVAEVMLPERDMVAGKAISNERRRLIVEADKIILVISPDYYESEWCSYELMHAIQNEPTLSRGRIIPILIDGCMCLPENMEVVVPLLAHEQDFSLRLQAAIHPHPRLSQ